MPRLRNIPFLCALLGSLLAAAKDDAKPAAVEPDDRFMASVHSFCLFTKWPAPKPGKPRQPLVIVTSGKPLPALASLGQRTVRKRAIRIVVLPAGEPLPEKCDVLVVNGLPPAKRDSLLAIAAQRPILTLSRDPGFCQAGGIVEFFVAKDRMRFRISRAHMKRAGIRIRSRLLKLAEIVPAPRRGQ